MCTKSAIFRKTFVGHYSIVKFINFGPHHFPFPVLPLETVKQRTNFDQNLKSWKKEKKKKRDFLVDTNIATGVNNSKNPNQLKANWSKPKLVSLPNCV